MKNQMTFPIDFNRIEEGQVYEICSSSVHVFMRLFVDTENYCTIGITTLTGCEGAFLSAPDLVSIILSPIPVIVTNIFGQLSAEQAAYLKRCFLEEPSQTCHTGHKVHLHRVKDEVGLEVVYNKWNPHKPDVVADNEMQHSINCGTWLTYFLRKNPEFNAERQRFFRNFYVTHMGYMWGKRGKTREYVTEISKGGKRFWATIKYNESGKVIKGSYQPISFIRKHRLLFQGYKIYIMKPEDY